MCSLFLSGLTQKRRAISLSPVNGAGGAQLAQLHQVPAIVRNLDDADCYGALIENIQRTDLTVIEEAQGYKSLLDTNRYTQDQLSKIIGKSRVILPI